MMVLRMVHGTPVKGPAEPVRTREPLLAVLPPAVLGLAVLALGVCLPRPLRVMIDEAARMLRTYQ